MDTGRRKRHDLRAFAKERTQQSWLQTWAIERSGMTEAEVAAGTAAFLDGSNAKSVHERLNGLVDGRNYGYVYGENYGIKS